MTCDAYGFVELSLFLRQEGMDIERTELALHLDTCPECRRKLSDIQAILATLPHGLSSKEVSPIRPPESLRQKTLAAAFAVRSPAPEVISQSDVTERTTEATGSTGSTGITEVSGSTGTTEATGSAEEGPASLATGRRRFLSKPPLWAWFAGTSAALIVVSGTLSVQLMSAHRQLSQLQLRMVQEQVKVGNYELKPTAAEQQAVGQAIVEQKGKQLSVYVLLTQTQPTQGSQVYHVWLLRNGRRISAGVFTVGQSGQAIFNGTLTGSWEGLNGIGITLEPNRSTKTPMGPKLFGAEL